MKTDALIAALAANVEPVAPRAALRRLVLAAAAGMAAAVPLMLGLLGLNPALAQAATLPMFWVKLGFVMALAAASLWLALRLLRPGALLRRPLLVAALPVLALGLLAFFVLAQATAWQRPALVLGTSWTACPWNIALLSAPALVVLLWAARSLAPTRLRLAGAATGLLAGALGALVYALHCPELAAPFVLIWYPLGMLLPAAAGALVAPRVLRW